MQKTFTLPVLFALEHGERSDPDFDDSPPNDYAFAFGAMSLPKVPQESLLTKKLIDQARAEFEEALRGQWSASDGADFSMFDGELLNLPGFAPFVVISGLVESDLSLDERESWGQIHLRPAAEVALGSAALNFAEFFPATSPGREAAIDAWSSLCLDSGSDMRKNPPPATPIEAAFAQWEALKLAQTLKDDWESAQLAVDAPPQSPTARAPRSL